MRPFHLFVTSILLSLIAVAAAEAAAAAGDIQTDRYRITLDPAVRSEPVTGRIVLFFITSTEAQWQRTLPIEGPFYELPQPIASVAVEDFKPGETVEIRGDMPAFPDRLDTLSGTVHVQAILDADLTERSHEQGPGNVYSDVAIVELSPDRADVVELTLTHRIQPPVRRDSANLKWMRLKSEMLSEFYGRDVEHRAGVALPPGYDDPANAQKRWPTIYVIPGFGSREDNAEEYAAMFRTPGIETIAPMAVYVVLDPEAPLGHHGFVNSANNGPRGDALVQEFIPYLESQLRLENRPEARIVTGHSSGGWTSLWLLLNYPDTFGACWSSAPDPIDFTAFQKANLYEDANLFRDAEGKAVASYRHGWGLPEQHDVLMTVEQECGMEHAIDPHGRSGQQWDAWAAMFSPRQSSPAVSAGGGGLPQPMFDPETGNIHRDVVEHWKRFDIAQMVSDNWAHYGPIVLNRMRLACGDRDSYYLERAVLRFRDKVEALRNDEPWGDGYILIVKDANHNLMPEIFQRWNKEMRDYLRKHGLHD